MKNTLHTLIQLGLGICLIGMAVQVQAQMVVVNVGINQPAALVAHAGQSSVTLCEGDSLVLGGIPTASGGMAPYTYAWSPGTNLSSTSAANPTASPTANVTYTLQLTDANNCTSGGSVAILMAAMPVAAFTSAPTSGLSLAFTDQTVGTATGWAWDFGDGGSSTLQNPTHTYAAPGQYTVCLTVSNGPCSDQFCTTLAVIVGLENAFAIPGLSVFPNPYQGTTQVQFSMTETAHVRLEAFDLSGKFVAQVFEGQLNAGPQSLHFSAADYGAAAGVYMLRLHVGDQQASLRVHELR